MKFRRDETPAGPTLADFDINHVLALLAGWRPPTPPDTTPWAWQTWAQYLDDFRRLRPELLARFGDRRGGRPMFGDQVLAYVAQHGAAALQAATYEQIRDDQEP